MRKKLFLFISVSIMVLMLVACGSTDNSTSSSNVSNGKEEPTPTTVQTENEKIENKYSQEDELGFYNLITFKKTGQSKLREDRPYMFYPILQKDGLLFPIEENEYNKLYNKETKTFDDMFYVKKGEVVDINLAEETITVEDKNNNI